MPGPFQPGQSVTFSTQTRVSGVLFSTTPAPTLTVRGPDGTLYTPSVVNDGTGLYHANFVIPLTAIIDTWWYRWRVVGADASNTGNDDRSFKLVPLGF